MPTSAVLIAISLLVSLIACVSHTTKKRGKFPRNITTAGWALMGLAAASAALNYWQTRQKAFSVSIEESVALQRLETAIYTLMIPATVDSDPPETSDRFQVVASFGSAGAVAGLCDIDITKIVDRVIVAPEYAGERWADVITETTRDGLGRIQQVQFAYGRLLDDETNLLIGRVVAHPWNEFLLATKGRLKRGVTSAGPRPLCLQRPAVRKEYGELADSYWKLLSQLESRVGRHYCALRAKLTLPDVTPVFLRYVSGLIFLPDPAKTKEETDKACNRLTVAKLG